MKFRKCTVFLLCLLLVVLIHTVEGKKKRRKKPKVQPAPTTQAPTTTTPTTLPRAPPRVTTKEPTRNTPVPTTYTPTQETPPVAAGACRRTCEGNSYLQHDQCICVCDQGYEYSSRTSYCEDINECNDESNCIGGACTNNRGSYYCICPVGYNLHANGKLCQPIPKVIPCRGLVCFGEAVLQEVRCRCWCSNPGLKYDYFKEKCEDINECVLATDNCEQGCINTVGSFMCYCFPHFHLNSDEMTCSPDPRPNPSNTECYGKCPGATGLNLLTCSCMCEIGFQYSEEDHSCIDINECVEFQGWCKGTCVNNQGSYTCTCPTGTILDADGWACNEPVPPTEELQCLDYEILCDHGNQCVQEGVVCDGYNDCGDGSDEKQCKPVCRPDQFSCANGRACLEATQRCNGENDCLDFSDELDCSCKDEKDECHAWRNRGECETNPGWMNWNCRESCKTCMQDDGTESGVVEENELPMLYFLRYSEDFSSTLQYTLRNTGSREQASGSRWQCHIITEVPQNVRAEFRLSYVYRKFVQAYNIPILGTERASEQAMKRACYVVRFLLADRRDLREAIYRSWGRIAVMDDDEVTVNIPEHSHLPELYNTVRGLGGTLHIPVASGATENLLCLENDQNKKEDMFVHVLAHTIRRISITLIIATFKSRLLGAYVNARKGGMWVNTRAVYTADEYFSQGVQSFFNVSTDVEINTREKLERYDPALYNLVKEIFPCMNTIVDRCDNDEGKKYTEQIRMNCNENGPGFEEDPDTIGDEVCRNLHHECPQWKEEGGCQNNAGWMSNNCPKSCDTCPEPKEEPVDEPPSMECLDTDERCPEWVQQGRCDSHEGWMQLFCEKSCNLCEGQQVIESELEDDYQPSSSTVDLECIDSHFLCEVNAEAGECITNESWMREHCPFSCDFCTDSVPHTTCQDSGPICRDLAEEGNCETDWIRINCKESCGLCDEVTEHPSTSSTSSTNNSTTPVFEYEPTCIDMDPSCMDWADAGECGDNPEYMKVNCPESCSYCSNPEIEQPKTDIEITEQVATTPVLVFDPVCIDLDPYCNDWAEAGECSFSPEYMKVNCPESCGYCSNPAEQPIKPNCTDIHPYCPTWVEEGDCETNPGWMHANCMASCNVCDKLEIPEQPNERDCFDTDPYCIDWADAGNCETDEEWMEVNCPESCGFCDIPEIPERPTASNLPHVDQYEPNCEDTDALCPGWAFYGGCYQNPEWMLPNCAYSCNSCHYIVNDGTEVEHEPTQGPVGCKDWHKLCPEWTIIGGCFTNPEWMMENCMVSCNLCDDGEGEATDFPPLVEAGSLGSDNGDDYFDKPVGITTSPDEETQSSDISEWIVEDIDTSDSWRESLFGDPWEDSQDDASFDQSEQSDSIDEVTTSDSPDKDGAMDSGDSLNEIVTQSAIMVTQSEKGQTESMSSFDTKTEQLEITSDESMPSQLSVTASPYSATDVQSILITHSNEEATQTILQDVTELQTNENGSGDDEVLTVSESSYSSTDVLTTASPSHIAKPNREFDWESPSTTYWEENIADPATDVHNMTSTEISRFIDVVTDTQGRLQEVSGTPSSDENAKLFTEVTDKLQKYPITPQRAIPSINVTGIQSESSNALSTTNLSIQTTDLTYRMTTSPVELTSGSTDSSSIATISPGDIADSLFNRIGDTQKLTTSSTAAITEDSHGVNQFPEKNHTMSSSDKDIISEVTQPPDTFTESGNLEPHTTPGLLHKLTHSPPRNSIPLTEITLNTYGVITLAKETTELLTDEVDKIQNEVIKLSTTKSPHESPQMDCIDDQKYCPEWAAVGGCESNPTYMLYNCRASCKSCHGSSDKESDQYEDFSGQGSNQNVIIDESYFLETESPNTEIVSYQVSDIPNEVPGIDCVDSSTYCHIWASYGGCESNPSFMLPNCRRSCNSCDFSSSGAEDKYDDGISGSETDNLAPTSDADSFFPTQVITKSPHEDTVTTTKSSSPTGAGCLDSSTFCTIWAKSGGCVQNPNWMQPNCKRSCNLCEYVEEESTPRPDETTYQMETQSYKEPTTEETQSNNNQISTDKPDPGIILECRNSHTSCEVWEGIGECVKNPTWMERNCRKSCNTCLKDLAVTLADCSDDYGSECEGWANTGECEINPTWMLTNCRKSCKTCNETYDDDLCQDGYDKCSKWKEEGECDYDVDWMRSNCKRSCGLCSKNPDKKECLDSYSNCTQWATDGECDSNPVWMRINCCQACLEEEPSYCVDKDDRCVGLRKDGACEFDKEWMLVHCRMSCEACNISQLHIPRPKKCLNTALGCAELALDGECDTDREWMVDNCCYSCSLVTKDSISGCADLKTDCTKWAEVGECDSNPDYMLLNCAKSCDSCSQCLDSDPARCQELLVANQDQCLANPASMLAYCPKTCNMCN